MALVLCPWTLIDDWPGNLLLPAQGVVTARPEFCRSHLLRQGVSISRYLVCEEALRLPDQALEQGRLLLLSRPRQVCWVLQEPQRLLPRLHLLRRPERAMVQGCVRLPQSVVWLRWGPFQCLLLHPVLVMLVRRDEAGRGAPS